jgi:hypothetical protein
LGSFCSSRLEQRFIIATVELQRKHKEKQERS